MVRSEHGGQGLPCVFSLLPDKSQTTYDMMLAAVADKVGIDGHPVVAMCDFERATINTLSAIFPHAKISGCMFHLRKAIWTHVQDCGLQSLFHRNADFNELIYKIFALSYVHPSDIGLFFEEQILVTIEKKLDKETGVSFQR